ncbi:DNA-binding protein [Nanoarchaeota archaeon]
MDELEELKKKKIQELQQRQQQALQHQAQEEAQLQQQIEQLEGVVKQFFTKEALQRYGNLKAAHPEKAVQVLVGLGQLVQSGKINQKITDDQLKELLRKIEPKKKDFTIKHI